MSIQTSKKRTGARLSAGPRFLLAGAALAALYSSCSVFATRPVQEMSDTTAAMRAAKEVQADSLAPELYRQANDNYFKAKHEYKFKNFKAASEFAHRARTFAEQAEFEALRNGGSRNDAPPDPNSVPTPSPAPYAYPSAEPTPADAYEERKAKEDAAAKQRAAPSLESASPLPTFQPQAH